MSKTRRSTSEKALAIAEFQLIRYRTGAESGPYGNKAKAIEAQERIIATIQQVAGIGCPTLLGCK